MGMKVFVLTGGIASGKSTVSKLLAHAGATIIDYDQLAREVVEPGTEGLAQIEARWGNVVLDASGRLNRSELASRVFSAPEELAALNAITHPLIHKRADELLRDVPADSIVIRDIPLYTPETDDGRADGVIVVVAPECARIKRMVTKRNMTVDEARARIGSQISDRERESFASFVVDNSGSLADLALKVEKLWEALSAELN